jgi:hypothetical protein
LVGFNVLVGFTVFVNRGVGLNLPVGDGLMVFVGFTVSVGLGVKVLFGSAMVVRAVVVDVNVPVPVGADVLGAGPAVAVPLVVPVLVGVPGSTYPFVGVCDRIRLTFSVAVECISQMLIVAVAVREGVIVGVDVGSGTTPGTNWHIPGCNPAFTAISFLPEKSTW